ncbi:MAG TPA: hypothetical protein VGA73_05375 [Candidatus Binatia bacterium]
MAESTSMGLSGAAAPAARTDRSATAALGKWLRGYGAIIAAYVAVTSMTDAYYMGDTGAYANLILFGRLFDFGHPLWLLLGWKAAALLQPLTGLDARTGTIFTLVALGWLAGLLSAVLVYSLSLRVARRARVAAFVTAAFIFTQGFLNFAQTGCSYIPGLALVLLGLWLLFREEDKERHAVAGGVAAGLAFSGAVGLWVPYVLTIPAVLVSTLLIFGWSARRARVALGAAVAFGLATALFFGAVAALNGIHDVAGFKEWALAGGQSITHINGFNRMVFGFARSFINMGNDGVLFKRYLLHDPYNPVSFADLLRFSLGKFLLFYACLAVWLAALLGSEKGRRFFLFLAASALPVMVFAWRWQGGDMERYLPLYPALFLALACVLSAAPYALLSRAAAAVWLIAVVYFNAGAMAKTTLAQRQNRVAANIQALQPLWKPHSHIATVLIQDDVFAFPWNFPFHPISTKGILAYSDRERLPAVIDIVDRGSAESPRWRQAFAKQALAIWSAGGDLWVAKGALASRPAADSAWVEGDDPRLAWRDVCGFFSALEAGTSVGGEDGFFLLPANAKNRGVLTRWSRS